MKYKKKKIDARRFSLLVLQKVEEEGLIQSCSRKSNEGIRAG